MDRLDDPRGIEPPGAPAGPGEPARARGGGLVALLRRWAGAPPARAPVERGCLRCGMCCEAFGSHLHASKADLERWTRLGREDLLRRVGPRTGWIWLDPETGTLEDACPFLRTIGPDTRVCGIHDVKPDMCRDYPTLAHARRCLRGVFLAWVLAPLLGPLLGAAALRAALGA